MKAYQRDIAEVIGSSDPGTVAAVEDMMRAEHHTLDHLTRRQFNQAARTAFVEAREMRTQPVPDELLHDWRGPRPVDLLDYYCRAIGLPAPVAE